jgi:hypothetical protein
VREQDAFTIGQQLEIAPAGRDLDRPGGASAGLIHVDQAVVAIVEDEETQGGRGGGDLL